MPGQISPDLGTSTQPAMPGATVSPVNVLSFAKIKQLWEQYGGSPSAADTAAAVAMAESGGNIGALNFNSNGSVDRGLFQINSVHGAQSTTNLAENVKAAIAISNNGANWSPWTTFTSGAYKKFLGGNQQPTYFGDQPGSIGSTINSLPSAIPNAITGVFNQAVSDLKYAAVLLVVLVGATFLMAHGFSGGGGDNSKLRIVPVPA